MISCPNEGSTYIASAMAISKAQRQEVRLLKRKSERWEKRRVFVEGVKCIQELCASNWKVERIYFTEPWADKDFWSSSDAVASVPRLCVSSKDMEMMSALKAPPGLLAVAHLPNRSTSPQKRMDFVSFWMDCPILEMWARWFELRTGSGSERCSSVLNAQTSLAPKPFKAPWAPHFTFHALFVLGASAIPTQNPRDGA